MYKSGDIKEPAKSSLQMLIKMLLSIIALRQMQEIPSISKTVIPGTKTILIKGAYKGIL